MGNLGTHKRCKIGVGEQTMTKQIYIPILLACLLNLPATDSSMADEVKDDDARRCISTRTLKKTAVVDDLNILFFKVGKTIYHNILPRQCTGLSRNRMFSYSTLSGSLCEFDTIQVLDGFGVEGRTCRLGYFQPITLEDIPALVNGPPRSAEPQPLPPAKTEDVISETDESGDPTQN